MSARGITIVGASAGSGKTTRLTQEVTCALDPNGAAPIDLTGLVAVTFTRKAHAELAARIRHKLVQSGAFTDAMRLPLAYIGTVHAACLRLLQEFALDAGLSPNIEVAAEQQSKLLQQALERSLDDKTRETLDRLSRRVELRIANQTDRVDWVRPVFDIMELARSNRIAPEQLASMAERSLDGYFSLFPAPLPDGAALDAALKTELGRAIGLLKTSGDKTGATKEALATLELAAQRLDDGEMPWSAWAKLAAVAPSKACIPHVTRLQGVAAEYLRHPRLREELRDLTHAIYEAARISLSAYDAWKKEKRVVDWVDMLDHALTLMDEPRVRDALSKRLELVVVDEFQDTSPIQLALFAKLHTIAGRSVWVGDRKQCIFEYAGADPRLMDDVTRWVESAGGARDQLGANYRSRPELVRVTSSLFSSALAKYGFGRDEIEVAAKRPEPPELGQLPAFGYFAIETKNIEDFSQGLAEGVRRILAAPDATPVVDRATEKVRPVRPGDIAVLVSTNDHAAKIAAALNGLGIRSAIARAGLLDTPEGTIADAALRWLLDERDTLAAATIDALTGFEGQSAEAWLADRLRSAAESVDGESVWRTALSVLRPELAVVSPSEALDRTLAALDVVHLCARWPDAPQRLANLDALRALAAQYEQRCGQQREAATVAGLLRYFDDVRTVTLQRDEMIGSDDQHVPTDDGAVVVCTYHKAKGLEWPVVIMSSLDKGERNDAFDVTPESDKTEFDPVAPLAGRWIRYWPWPFGATKKTMLRELAATSPEGLRVWKRENQERARLLYVGFTRARDHLVLAAMTSKGKPKAGWLFGLTDEQGGSLVELPTSDSDAMRIGTEVVTARVTRLTAASEKPERAASAVRWFKRGATGNDIRPPFWITPSAEERHWPELNEAVAAASIGAVERLPSALVLTDTTYDYEALGNAVHAFLAADGDGLSSEARRERARLLLVGHGLTGIVAPESLLKAGDALKAWVTTKWPGAVWRRETPVETLVQSAIGERRVRGIIDLLLETPDGRIIIDHKTFPGTTEAAWRARCVTYAPQLATYRRVLGPSVAETWIHLPVGGAAVLVTCR